LFTSIKLPLVNSFAICPLLVPTRLRTSCRSSGEQLANQQELLGHIADIASETYALESAMLRTSKLVAAGGERSPAVPIDITHVYASDAADRMEHSAKQVLESAYESIECSCRQGPDKSRTIYDGSSQNRVGRFWPLRWRNPSAFRDEGHFSCLRKLVTML